MIHHQEIGVIGKRSIGMVLASLIIGMGLIPTASLRADPPQKIDPTRIEKVGKLITCGENSHFDSEKFRCVCDNCYGREPDGTCVPLNNCREEDHKMCNEQTGYCICMPCFGLDPDGYCVPVSCGQNEHCNVKEDRCECDVGAFYDSKEGVCVMKKMKKGK